MASDTVQKSSLAARLAPYGFAIAILVWVFTGLSSPVKDEVHTMRGQQWTALAHPGAAPDSIAVEGAGQCDLEHRTDEAGMVYIRRSDTSNIADGATVLVSYQRAITLAQLGALLRGADLRLFLPAMLLLMLAFFGGDIFGFGTAYRRFNAPGMTWREVAIMRGGPYIIQIGLAPVAEALFPLYLLRQKRVPITETVSSNLWIFAVDLAVICSLITLAVLYNLLVDPVVPALGVGWLAACAVCALFLSGLVLMWKTPWGKRLEQRVNRPPRGEGPASKVGGALGMLRSFSRATGRDYAQAFGARLLMWAGFWVANYAALLAMGVRPPLPLAMVGIPLVVVSIFMPIGVGGFGGPQLIAWYLFTQVGQAGDAERVIAYSFLFSSAFMAGRAIIGGILIRPFWSRCFGNS